MYPGILEYFVHLLQSDLSMLRSPIPPNMPLTHMHNIIRHPIMKNTYLRYPNINRTFRRPIPQMQQHKTIRIINLDPKISLQLGVVVRGLMDGYFLTDGRCKDTF